MTVRGRFATAPRDPAPGARLPFLPLGSDEQLALTDGTTDAIAQTDERSALPWREATPDTERDSAV